MVRTVTRYTVALFATYMLAWTVSYVYVFISRGDSVELRYYIPYFVAAWTFAGFELPIFMWAISVAIFLPLSLVAVTLVRRYNRRFSTEA
jgi:hypothetical protein